MTKTIKLQDIQNVYLNGDKVTKFNVYSLVNNTWIYDYSDYLYGWYKRESTILKKHIEFNNH